MEKHYYPGLNGFRALAVGSVMASHAALGYPKSGSVGVDLFFVLSGFLITTLLANEYSSFGHISVARFYFRRTLRLLPGLVLVCATYAVLKYFLSGTFPGETLVIIFTYSSNWARALYGFNLHSLAHTWSLSSEEQFYFLWPFVILCLERSSRVPYIKGIFLGILAIAAILYRAIVVTYFSLDRVHFGLDTHLDGLLAGAGLAYGILEIRRRAQLSEAFSWWLGRVLAPSALIFIFISFSFSWKNLLMEYFGGGGTDAAAGILILDIVEGRHSALRMAFEQPILIWIGRISYGLYLWHPPIYHAVDRCLAGVSRIYTTPIKVSVSVGIAAISFYLIERKFLLLKDSFETRADPVRRKAAIPPVYAASRLES